MYGTHNRCGTEKNPRSSTKCKQSQHGGDTGTWVEQIHAFSRKVFLTILKAKMQRIPPDEISRDMSSEQKIHEQTTHLLCQWNQ